MRVVHFVDFVQLSVPFYFVYNDIAVLAAYGEVSLIWTDFDAAYEAGKLSKILMWMILIQVRKSE